MPAQLFRVMAALVLALPLLLVVARGIADGALSLIGLLFLLHSALTRDWSWIRRPWFVCGLAWWGWLVAVTLPYPSSYIADAVVIIRYLIFLAALEHLLLAPQQVRRWLSYSVMTAAAYIVFHTWWQFIFGRSLFGHPRFGDGQLTGPYDRPRAGAVLARLLYPATLPLMAYLPRAIALLPLILGMATVMLLGQRMPVLLMLFGLFLIAILYRPLLKASVLMGVTGALLIGISATLSPPTFNRLVTKFSSQILNFANDHYGQVYTRVFRVIEANPWLGTGANSFRRECFNPAYFQGLTPMSDGGGADICVIHPHNIYLQALVESGIPGLLLFITMVLCWLIPMGRGLIKNPSITRLALFVAALMHLWPLSAASSYFAMPYAGIWILFIGWGLVETRSHPQPEEHPA